MVRRFERSAAVDQLFEEDLHSGRLDIVDPLELATGDDPLESIHDFAAMSRRDVLGGHYAPEVFHVLD